MTVWITALFVVFLLLGATFLASRNSSPKSSEVNRCADSLNDLKVYHCPACKHKITEADENWYSILYTEHCPNCGKWLPDDLFDKFCCASCGRIKDIKELGRINRVAQFVLNSLPAPRMKKICNRCKYSANFYGWFILSGAIFSLAFWLFGNHAPKHELFAKPRPSPLPQSPPHTA
jgi:predicted RNA-binding Zn-ribbon protein involved in translation (DUF1610 family)